MSVVMECPATLRPAMEGLVEEVHLRNTNYLTLNRVYSKIGATRVIASDPSVVHYGGFQLGQVYSQTLHIRNIGGAGTRVHIIPPTTPFFKATCNSKRGLVAPGLAEEIAIEFCPQEWRYYYDCIRIHSEDENLLVPLHGYPVMNEAKFPRRVDFGRCAIGVPVTRKVCMECKVPIEFEVELRELKPCTAITVSPMSAIVPAHGHVSFDITFTPTKLATEELQLEVKVAEFNSKPIVCSVVGSAFPGAARDKLVAEITGVPRELSTMEHLDGTVGLRTASSGTAGGTSAANKGGGTARGGAGNGDAYTAFVSSERRATGSQRDCRTAGPIKMRLPALPGAPGEVVVGGVHVPEGLLQTAADMAYVLNQQPGKLRTKDVKHAIAERRKELQAQQEALDAVLERGRQQGVHPLERPEVAATLKAKLFRMQLQQAEEVERHASLGASASLGEVVMAQAQVERAQQLREAQHKQQQLANEQADMARLRPEMFPSGAVHMPCISHSSDTASTGSECPKPQWRLAEANDFPRRAQALHRFVCAARNIVYSLRLQRRLERLTDVLNQLGRDPQKLAEEAANPVLLAMQDDRPGTAPTKHLRPENVRTRPLPLYREVLFNYHGPVPQTNYTDFDQLTEFQPQVPLQYRILGYTPEEFPGLTPYAPLLMDQPLMTGAVEEVSSSGGMGAPCGVVPSPQSLPAMPDSCKQMPFVILEVGNRYTEDKVLVAPEPSWGMDAAYLQQPRQYALHDSARHESAPSGTVRALRGIPLLCDSWLPRRDAWQVQLTPEVVPPLMTGPDPADAMPESHLDADKPRVSIVVPSQDELSQLLPKALPPTAEALPVAVTPGSAISGYQMLRQRRQDELDTAKRASRMEAISSYTAALEEYNAKLNLPCYYALKPAS